MFSLQGLRVAFGGVTPGELRCSSRVEDVVGALNPKP